MDDDDQTRAAGSTDLGGARQEARGDLGPRIATPPIETPGPSVTGPALPQSETERQEWADERKPDEEILRDRGATSPDPLDLIAEEEASAAAAEAAAIGGPVDDDPGIDDPAMVPVYQAGQGEQDGWDAAERDLIDTIEGVDPTIDPTRDALAPEAESDRASIVYGDADAEHSSSLTFDPEEPRDETPGAGPGMDRVQGANMEPDVERHIDPDRLPGQDG
jgi:hypothetical protein